MKRRYIFLIFLLTFGVAVLFGVDGAWADFRDAVSQQTGAAAGEQGAGFSQAVDPRIVAARVIRALLGFVGTLFLVYTVYAGFLWMTSAGAEDKIDKAKSTIRTAVLGVIITLASYMIVTFVSNALIGAINFKDAETGFEVFFKVDSKRDNRDRYNRRDPFEPVQVTPFDDPGYYSPGGG